MKRWLMVGVIALGACALESEQPPPEQTAATQQELHELGWYFDWCELFGWYGDGEYCDEFCPKPDPDCGPDGEMCAGLLGLACPADEFCDWDDNSCGAADQTGICEPIPEACTEVYDPVCGCDDQTYSNECFAHMAGVDVALEGECPSDEPGEDPVPECLSDDDCAPDEHCTAEEDCLPPPGCDPETEVCPTVCWGVCVVDDPDGDGEHDC